MIPKNFIRLLSRCRPQIRFNFCSTPQITPRQKMQKFAALMKNGSDNDLKQAAQMMADIQLIVEKNQQEIIELQDSFNDLNQASQKKVMMMRKLMLNVDEQKKEIQSIYRRAEKELSDCKNYSVSHLARETLEIADSLKKCYDLAINIHNEGDEAVLRIKKAQKELLSIYEVYGIQEFDPVGEDFDPNKQEAMLKVPLQEGVKSNTVAYTIRTGYMIKERLLRSAHVGVYQ